MTSARVFFVRHARAIVDLAAPSREWPLAPGAEAELDPIETQLNQTNMRTIWSSPELRALSTANHLAASSGSRVEILCDLSEHKRDGAYRHKTERQFIALQEQFFDRPDELVFGQETASEALDRFKKAINFVLSREPDDAVIVTHGTVLSLYLGGITNAECFQIWRNLKTPDLVEIPRKSVLSISSHQ